MFSRRSLFTALGLSVSSLAVATTGLAATTAKPKKRIAKAATNGKQHAKAKARPAAKPVTQG